MMFLSLYMGNIVLKVNFPILFVGSASWLIFPGLSRVPAHLSNYKTGRRGKEVMMN